MGKVTGFIEFGRKTESYVEVKQRVKDFQEFTIPLNQSELKKQGARCMNCGIPFCHSGCPLGNLIPDFNEAVYKGQWQKASNILHQTNNFPEFTGRLCPAPCEEACVLNINSDPVTIENIEKNIAEQAFANNWLVAEEIKNRTGKKVAVIGSGPAGGCHDRQSATPRLGIRTGERSAWQCCSFPRRCGLPGPPSPWDGSPGRSCPTPSPAPNT